MDPEHMAKLQLLRDRFYARFKKGLIVASGARCEHWNTVCGGSPKSQHKEGKATDLLHFSVEECEFIAATAEEIGFGGIGIYLTFIHVDSGPAGRRWKQ